MNIHRENMTIRVKSSRPVSFGDSPKKKAVQPKKDSNDKLRCKTCSIERDKFPGWPLTVMACKNRGPQSSIHNWIIVVPEPKEFKSHGRMYDPSNQTIKQQEVIMALMTHLHNAQEKAKC